MFFLYNSTRNIPQLRIEILHKNWTFFIPIECNFHKIHSIKFCSTIVRKHLVLTRILQVEKVVQIEL